MDPDLSEDEYFTADEMSDFEVLDDDCMPGFRFSVSTHGIVWLVPTPLVQPQGCREVSSPTAARRPM